MVAGDGTGSVDIALDQAGGTTNWRALGAMPLGFSSSLLLVFLLGSVRRYGTEDGRKY